MSTRRFKVVLEQDRESDAWVAYVPSLHGIATQGDTREDALRMAEELILGHLEGLAQDGLSVEESAVEVVDIDVPITGAAETALRPSA
jgi:predicted RNase H-like HicB family nuclease